MRKLIFTLIIVLLFLNASYSQANIQAYSSFVRNLNPDYKGNTYGGGLRVEFGTEESSISYYAGFGYNLPVNKTFTQDAHAMNSSVFPSSVSVKTTYNLPMYRLEAGARYYFAGEHDNFEGVNFYANFGAELIVTPNKAKFAEYDRNNYSLGYSSGSDVNEDGSEKRAINIMLAGGLGIEKNIGPGNIFLQGAMAFPATQSGNTDISSLISEITPIPVNINLGFKLPLGSR